MNRVPPEICSFTASALARRIRAREISAREVLEAHLERIAQVNPRVNAIVTLVEEEARAQALKLDEAAAHGEFAGPLHGLPVAHKDLIETRGIRTTYGSPIFENHVPDFSTLLVERTQRAGAVTIGKTNTPEFGAGSQTFNPVFGATRNPYDVSKTCGGSSGGAAVALACGMTPLADGTDFGGSLRNPASFCSVVGFRPSPGRVPNVPAKSGWNAISVCGPMGRTVEDVALFLSAIAGPDPRAPLSIHEPGSRFAGSLGRECRGLRIAWCSKFANLPFDQTVTAVIDTQRKAFEAVGCITEDADPDFAGADEAFKTLRALSFYQAYHGLLEQHRGRLKATVIEEIERGARLTGPRIAAAESQRTRLFGRVAEFMERYDFLVLPTVQVPPFPIEQEFVTEIAGTKLNSYVDWMRSCYYVSITSLPAISVPAGFTPGGLPVGLQIVGRHQDDWGVLQIAHAFEQASGVKSSIVDPV